MSMTQHSGTHEIDLRGLHDAIDTMKDAYWSDTFCGAGPSLTCREAEALAALFRALGLGEAAENLIQNHGFGDDDPEDDHHDIYLGRHS